MSKDKIVITGAGAITPQLQDRIFDGVSTPVGALSAKNEEDISILCHEVPEYSRIDRTAHLALLAARIATDEAQKDNETPIAVNISSSRGATGIFEKTYEEYRSQKRLSPLTSPTTTLGNISSWVLQDMGRIGAPLSHSITCSSALYSFGNALAWMRSGMIQEALVGGSEAPLTPYTIAQMKALKIYSPYTDSSTPCRPLEKTTTKKNTFVLSEAAAVFQLAFERDATQRPRAIVESFGYGSEKIAHPTAISENGECFYQAMKSALEQQEDDSPIDLVLLHAPGTIKGDQAEINALARIFKDPPAIYSTKVEYGHTLAASGALSIWNALKLFETSEVPKFPYESYAEQIDRPIRKVLINAAGFGGVAASIILRLPDG